MTVAVDASAFLAIYLKEPDGEVFKARIVGATTILMSPVNYWEAMARARWIFGEEGVADAGELMDFLGIRIEAVTEEQARLAVSVHGRFGKGRPANLNLGDCFAYALSKATGAPLLFKGNDFPRTDVSAAV